MVYDMMQIFADHIFLQKLQVFASFVAMVFQSLLIGIRKIEQEDFGIAFGNVLSYHIIMSHIIVTFLIFLINFNSKLEFHEHFHDTYV